MKFSNRSGIMKSTIEIRAGNAPYEIIIGKNVLEPFFSNELPQLGSGRIFVIVDENVYKLHNKRIDQLLENTELISHKYILPEGEQSKSVKTWRKLVDFMLENEVKRNSLLLAVGGGVTGDVAGFAAASVLRGIPLIHIPTTLLAMVDSSIGGKTGINHDEGKNLIGAFYQPQKVLADISFLATLPSKEWVNGLSEVLKYAFIQNYSILKDVEFFLETDTDFHKYDKLVPLIEKCVRVKADIVEMDEFESGIRAFLNFGHTFGHALEKEAGYSKISHGEAVYAGMVAAVYLSNMLGAGLDQKPVEKFRELYRYHPDIPGFDVQSLIRNMKSDKKRLDSGHRLILLKDWEEPFIYTTRDETLLEEIWLYTLNFLKEKQRS